MMGSFNFVGSKWNWAQCLANQAFTNGIKPTARLAFISSTKFVVAGQFASVSTSLCGKILCVIFFFPYFFFPILTNKQHRYSNGNDDSFVSVNSFIDGTCTGATAWGVSGYQDHAMGVSVDSTGNVFLGVCTYTANNAAKQNLIKFMSVLCNFGTVSPSTQKCQCNQGYVGTTCNVICPGGATTPCSNNGACYLNGNVSACQCFQG